MHFRIGKRGLEPAQHLHPDLGNVGALAEITDRVEGRALQALRIAGDHGGPVQMGIETQSLEDLRREIKKFQDRIRARGLAIE